MKKIIAISFIIIGVTSCKKDRVCTCTYADGTTQSQSTFTNVTKKEARNLCNTNASGVTCSVK